MDLLHGVDRASCIQLPPFTYVDVGLPYIAAIDSVQRWIRTGEPAAPSIRFERNAAGQIVRDANGDVVGGIRLAQYLFPTADQEAVNGTAFPVQRLGMAPRLHGGETQGAVRKPRQLRHAGHAGDQAARQGRLRAAGRRRRCNPGCGAVERGEGTVPRRSPFSLGLIRRSAVPLSARHVNPARDLPRGARLSSQASFVKGLVGATPVRPPLTA